MASREQLPGVRGDGPEPFVSYTGDDASVNWSGELEAVHTESSRTHFLDRWTREAIIDGIGPLAPAATVADLGCSTGFLLEDLHARHPQASLIGVDMIAAGLRKAHDLVPMARLLQADVCALPLADESLDAVVSANLLEHVPDDRQALREIARVLRPGCPAAIVVPAGPGTYDYYDRFLGHVRRYGRRELASKCAGAGLTPIVDGFIASLLYPAFWLVKQRNRRRGAQLRGQALRDQVTADIAHTHRSRVGEATWRCEDQLVRAGIRLPFGIRSLVAVEKPEAAQ